MSGENVTHVLASAQRFGFGPPGSLLSLIAALDRQAPGRFHFHVVSGDTLAPLVRPRANLTLIDPPPDGRLLDALLADHGRQRYDLVLSSFDPSAVAYGWYHRIPTALYDGLFTFWELDGFAERLDDDLASLAALRDARDEAGLVRRLDELFARDPHEVLFGAHYLADRSFVRRNPSNAARFARHPRLRPRATEVGVLMNPWAVAPRPLDRREHIVVSTSGSLAPIVSFADNVAYAGAVLEFACEAARHPSLRQHPWWFVAHPQIAAALAERRSMLPPNLTLRPSLPPPEFWQLLAGARASFSGSGFMAIEEAAYLEVPTFQLGEHSASYTHCLVELRRHGYPIEHNLTATGVLHDFVPTYGEADIGRLHADVRRVLTSPELAPVRAARLDELARVLADAGALDRLVREQREAVAGMMGGFDGADQVARQLIDGLAA